MVATLIVLSVVCAVVVAPESLGTARTMPRRRIASALLALATLVVWIARVVESGHLPLFGTFESALSIALATTLAGAVWPTASFLTSLVSALVLAQGMTYDRTRYALTISERSLVVDVHAFLAWAAFGVFAVGFGMAARMAFTRDLSEPRLERVLTIGFVLHTAMIATGSLYKFMLFGKVWSWDPIETMALIAWLAYGTLLHMPLLAGWSMRRVARWSITTFVILVVSYRAIVYFPSFATYHIFDISLKLHR